MTSFQTQDLRDVFVHVHITLSSLSSILSTFSSPLSLEHSFKCLLDYHSCAISNVCYFHSLFTAFPDPWVPDVKIKQKKVYTFFFFLLIPTLCTQCICVLPQQAVIKTRCVAMLSFINTKPVRKTTKKNNRKANPTARLRERYFLRQFIRRSNGVLFYRCCITRRSSGA